MVGAAASRVTGMLGVYYLTRVRLGRVGCLLLCVAAGDVSCRCRLLVLLLLSVVVVFSCCCCLLLLLLLSFVVVATNGSPAQDPNERRQTQLPKHFFFERNQAAAEVTGSSDSNGRTEFRCSKDQSSIVQVPWFGRATYVCGGLLCMKPSKWECSGVPSQTQEAHRGGFPLLGLNQLNPAP